MRKLGGFKIQLCQSANLDCMSEYMRFPEDWLGQPGVSVGPMVCLEKGACEKGRKPVRNMTMYNIKINALKGHQSAGWTQCSEI